MAFLGLTTNQFEYEIKLEGKYTCTYVDDTHIIKCNTQNNIVTLEIFKSISFYYTCYINVYYIYKIYKRFFQRRSLIIYRHGIQYIYRGEHESSSYGENHGWLI